MAWIVNYTDSETGATYQNAYASITMHKLNVVKPDKRALFIGVNIYASKALKEAGRKPIAEKPLYIDAGGIENLPNNFDVACQMIYPMRELFTELDIIGDDI